MLPCSPKGAATKEVLDFMTLKSAMKGALLFAAVSVFAFSMALSASADVADPGDEGDDDAPECECTAVGSVHVGAGAHPSVLSVLMTP
jgi:hypothetical protein